MFLNRRKKCRPLGRILVDGDFVSESHLTQALAHSRECNRALGEVLTEMGLLDPEDLDAVLWLQKRLHSPQNAWRLAGNIRRKLGAILLQTNRLTRFQLHRALEEQQRTGDRLGAILLRMGYLEHKDLSSALRFQSQCRDTGEAEAPLKVLRLGELLVRSGWILREDLEKALEEQKKDCSSRLGEILVVSGKISQRQADRALWLQKKLLKAAMIAAMAIGPSFYTGIAAGKEAAAPLRPAAPQEVSVSMGMETAATTYDWLRMAKEEADWILTAQQPGGAIALMPDGDSINPYVANIALQRVVHLGKPYLEGVRRYLDWYIAHINREPDEMGVAGTIYDFRLQNGREIPSRRMDPSLPAYDSSDSYAATFLSLVHGYFQACGDSRWVQENLDGLLLIAGAIDATLQPNGLTFAKMNNRMQYLRDNVEVWRGYSDFSELLEAVGHPDAGKYRYRAELVRAGIEAGLYSKATQSYRAYAGSQATNWRVFYPDAVSNLWPIILDLPEARSRRIALYRKFIDNQSGWLRNKADAFPWVSIAVAAARLGDARNLKCFLSSTYSNFFPERKWPWHIAESGWFAETMCLQPF